MPRRASRSLAAIVLAAMLVFAAACASTGQPREDQPRTYVVVENRNFLDMTVYVWRGAERIRLGNATGSSTTRLLIPQRLVFGATALRFQADPVGGSATPVSMEVIVSPGEEVTITIPS
jgi:hypothetical protein